MKRIGEVLPTFRIPTGPPASNGAAKREQPAYRCPICKDAGWVKMDVPVGHPNFGRVFQCQCKVEEKADRERESLRRQSNLDAFTNHDFTTFEPTPGTEEAYNAAVEFARQPHGWLFLRGGVGVGKTHLAVAAALEVQKRNKVLFAVAPDLLDHLRTSFDPAQGVPYDERFNEIRSVFLLVLDDLGTENTTPWAREKLYQIFNYRYVERLPTIITSNQENRHIDERILSRLLDTHLTQDVTIEAEDYRRRGRADYTRGRRPR
ncbi:MAG: ATP-binding protein [Thermomicrobiales bacterium]